MTAAIPTFDTGSPDAEILAAFDVVRAKRTWVYSFDGQPHDPEREAALDAADEEAFRAEQVVEGTPAATIPGVVARLTVLLPQMDQDRWLDRGLMEQGLLALLPHLDAIEGHAQQVALAARDLVSIEWEQNLAAYERSTANFNLAIELKGVVEAEELRLKAIGLEPDAFLRNVSELADRIEDHHSNAREIERLARTLVPDHDAYLRKVEIIIAECFQADATPWLARDTAYLAGRITPETREAVA